MGLGDGGTPGRRDAGTWDSGTPGCGTRGRRDARVENMETRGRGTKEIRGRDKQATHDFFAGFVKCNFRWIFSRLVSDDFQRPRFGLICRDAGTPGRRDLGTPGRRKRGRRDEGLENSETPGRST